MGEVCGRAVVGIMEEVTLLRTAESVGGWEGVAVWVCVLRGRIRVVWPVETGQGWRQGRGRVFPW